MSGVVEKLRGVARRTRAMIAPRALILLYHRVAHVEPGKDPHNLCVSPARFDEQMAVLAKRLPVFPLATLVKHIEASTLPHRCAAVTFDDGYADNLHNAKPILERHGVPATVFVTTGEGGRSEELYWDECQKILPAADVPEVCGEILEMSPAMRRTKMRELRAAAGVEAPDVRATHRVMTDAEIADLAAGGLVEIGAHTVNHPSLPSLTPSEQLAEIADSKSRLESILGRPVNGFAYPYGLHTPESVDAARAAGFHYACTTLEHAARFASEALRLPRFDMGDCDGDIFDQKITWALGR